MTRQLCFTFLALWTFAITGCDNGGYDSRLGEFLDKQGKDANVASTLFAEFTDIPKSGARIRFPQFFAPNATKYLQNEAEAHPPAFQVPGLQWTMEMVPTAGDKLPVYVYLGVVEVGVKKRQREVIDEIINQTKGKYVGKVFANVSITKADGSGTVDMKKLTLTGKQKFDASARGGGSADADGTLHVYVYSTPSAHIILGWRVAKAAAGGLNFENAVNLSMGTLN